MLGYMSSLAIALILLLAAMQLEAGSQGKDQQLRYEDASVPSSSLADTAALIGVSSEIEELKAGPQVTSNGSQDRWRTLTLHQRIFERVTIVELRADATIASIDNEIARATEVRSFLADRRDRSVTRANLLSALLGGGLSAASAGLQLSAKQINAAVATGIAGGAMSSGLAIYGIRAQRGSARVLDAESNMLASFFGRPEMATSHYPAVIWKFLNEVAPSDPDHLIRRERLMRSWLEVKRLDSISSPSGLVKIRHITSMPEEHFALTIDDLEDRAAMLQDVRAKLSFLKRDLAALLASLPDLSPEVDSPTGAH